MVRTALLPESPSRRPTSGKYSGCGYEAVTLTSTPLEHWVRSVPPLVRMVTLGVTPVIDWSLVVM